MDTKRIVISGWYGNKNVGDEAQLSSMISMIRFFWPNAEIAVLTDDPKATISEHQVNAISRGGFFSKLKLLLALFKADLFILGGGTLLYDTKIGANQIKWLNEAILSMMMGTPVMYFNGGIGLIYNQITKYYIKMVCSAMSLITVRDEQSKENLRCLGVKKAIYIGADSVFALKEQSIEWIKKYNRENLNKKPKIGFNLRSWIYVLDEIPTKNKTKCEKFGGSSSNFVRFRYDIAEAINCIKEKIEASIIFFPISFSSAIGDNDVELSEEIFQLLADCKDVYIIKDECKYLEMINQMKDFYLVIGMRLHALVFAALLGIPMLAINYDSKVAAFMKLIDQEEYLLNMDEVTPDILCQKANQLLICRDEVAKKIEQKVTELANNSENSAHLMFDFLNIRQSKLDLMIDGFKLSIGVIPLIFWRNTQSLFGIIHYIFALPHWLLISKLLRWR